MTFEEFFTKKKIDLVQLEKAEPTLYSEFKTHFASMGEKSFDHTKKFWFNKLRRLYHLTPPEKAITQIETAIASQAEPLSSPTIEQKPAFTPRFKSTNIPKAEPTTQEQPATTPVPKPAFKPRNILTKAVEPKAEESQEPKTESTPVAKPAFRPRNIPTKAPEQKTEEIKAEANPPIKSPGFKPRNIKPVSKENAADANRTDSRPGQAEVSDTPITNPEKVEEAAKAGYKPKFKLKNIPRNPSSTEDQTGHSIKQESVPESQPEKQTDSPVESDIERKISSSTDEKTSEQEIQDNDSDLRGSDDAGSEDKPKPVYKPKFNLKNIKKQNPEE